MHRALGGMGVNRWRTSMLVGILVAALVGGWAKLASAETSAGPAVGEMSLGSLVETPAPVVFNHSISARPGDVISIQGENFGSSPSVWLEQSASNSNTLTQSTPLSVLNRVGTGWLAVQIPANATGGLALRLNNGAKTIARPVLMNAAALHHLEATEIVPNGAFRLFGRNLRLPGSTPTLSVNGQQATIDLSASDEHMLVAIAPAGLQATASAFITVDNGNGTGPAQLDRKIAVVTGASGDPLGLGVGWAAAYSPLLGKVIDATSDTGLNKRMVCNGQTDDGPALQEALDYAARMGGAVVQLPAGVCRLAKPSQIRSKTVLQGAGKDKTELKLETDSAIFGNGMDTVALRNMTVTNLAVTAPGASNGAVIILKDSARIAIQNVKFKLGDSSMFVWVYNNRNVAIQNSEFIQGGTRADGSMFADNSGLVFQGNFVSFFNGVGTHLDRVRDAYIQGNSWARDASRQAERGAVVTHTITVNFSHRIAIVGNKFEAVNGWVKETDNDSETILTEGGGAARTEGLGEVLTGSADSITVATDADMDRALRAARLPNNGPLRDNVSIAIIAGKGAGQSRTVRDVAARTINVNQAWEVVPDSTSRFATAVWGLEKALLKNNRLTQNPRGIWVYSTAARELDIVGNEMIENGGIYIRSFQAAAKNWFSPLYNIRIEGNTVSNSRIESDYASNVAVHLSTNDSQPLGISHIGVEVRNNVLTANVPNRVDSATGVEGFMNLLNSYSTTYSPGSVPQLLGTVFQGNTCTNCETGFRLGTGVAGTVLWNNLVSGGVLWTNTTTVNFPSGSVATGALVKLNESSSAILFP